MFATSRLDIVKHTSNFQETVVAYSFVGETLKCFESCPEWQSAILCIYREAALDSGVDM